MIPPFMGYVNLNTDLGDNLTPFTFRDGWTFLQRLEALCNKINELIDAHNQDVQAIKELNDIVNANAAAAKSYTDALEAKIDAEMVLMEQRLRDLIAQTNAEGVLYDPTSGSHSTPANTVIDRVYSYDRIFGYFASDYGRLDALTAGGLDSLAMTAREYDLYPQSTVNDIPGKVTN